MGQSWLLAFDLDGVVYRGEQVLSGAREAIEAGRSRKMEIRFVTNNSTKHRRAVAARLRGMGIEAAEEEVLTSGAAAARWLGLRLPAGAPVCVLGEEGLMEELEAAGFRATYAGSVGSGNEEEWAAVVVGLDRGFSFEGLTAAQQAVRSGALYVASNADPVFPVEGGVLPGAGAIVAALSVAAESEPVVVGKPHSELAGALSDTTGIPAARTILVGDRLETDILMGRDAGMHTVLVLTGVTGLDDLETSDIRADRVLNTLSELPDALDELAGSPEAAN